MSNSENMNVAERLAQKLKASEIGQLLDEDDVTDIAQQAIQKAFFAPRLEPQSYGSPKVHEPQIIAEAREALKPLIAAKAKEIVDALAATPEFQRAIMEAAVAVLPAVITEWSQRLVAEAARQGADRALEQTQAMLRQRFGQ